MYLPRSLFSCYRCILYDDILTGSFLSSVFDFYPGVEVFVTSLHCPPSGKDHYHFLFRFPSSLFYAFVQGNLQRFGFVGIEPLTMSQFISCKNSHDFYRLEVI